MLLSWTVRIPGRVPWCPLGRQTIPLVLLAALIACSGGDEGPDNPNQPSPPTGGSAVFYTAIGASDAIGFGGSVPCVPFTRCPDGTGYVQTIARRLEQGREVTLLNLGVPGSVLSRETQDLGGRYGRSLPGNFIDQQVPFVARNSTLVTVFAGGNDTNTIAFALEQGAGGSDPAGFLASEVTRFRRDMERLVDGIRSRAGNPRIVVANLPNLAALPYLSGASLRDRQVVQRLSVGFSTEGINTLVGRNVFVVDLLCDPRSYDPSSYSGDGFHPNDRGYAFLAEKMLEAINGSVPPPPGSCPEMTVVPPL